MSNCFIYRYIFNDETIYVGKTRRDLKLRVLEHSKEEKFLPYIKKCTIEYFDCENRQTMDIYEKYLINKMNPLLNVLDKDNVEFNFSLPYIEWLPYKKYKIKAILEEEKTKEELLQKQVKKKMTNIQRSICACKKRIQKLKKELLELRGLQYFLTYHSIEEFINKNLEKIDFDFYFDLPACIPNYQNGKEKFLKVYYHCSERNDNTKMIHYILEIENLKKIFKYGYEYLTFRLKEVTDSLIREILFLKEKELEKVKIQNKQI